MKLEDILKELQNLQASSKIQSDPKTEADSLSSSSFGLDLLLDGGSRPRDSIA